MSKKLSAEEVSKQAKALNPLLALIAETYVDTHTPCEWEEEGFGRFWRTPKHVLRRKQYHHPQSVLTRRKSTCLEKYGTDTPTKAKSVKEKTRKTCLQRYGVASPSKSKSIQQKFKDACIEKYGVDNPSKAPDVKDKKKKASLEKYGVDYPFQSLEVQEKIKRSNLDKYGADNPQKSKVVRDKTKATCTTKYGVDCSFKADSVKKKIKQTFLNNYGVDHPLKISKLLEKAFETKLRRGLHKGSEGESDLLDFCKTHIDCDSRSTMAYLSKKSFQIDVFLPSKNICIEYNGMYWHSESVRVNYSRKHLDKTKACALQDRMLIHVWENEWQTKRAKMESYLLAKCGIFERRVPARKCTIQEVHDKSLVKAFLNDNHLLGSCSYTKAVGLYFQDELVGVAVIGKHHRQNSNEIAVLKRFAFQSGTQVIGGASKLTSHLFDYTDAKKLLTWAEIRLGAGDLYTKAGWELDGQLAPDYFYWDDRKELVVSKQSQKDKHKGSGLTEAEFAKKEGLHKIYDCGKLRFTLRNPKTLP